MIATKNFNVYRGIFNLDGGAFGFTSSNYTVFYKIENKELIKISEKNMDRPSYDYKDSALIPGTEYIATLYGKEIFLFNKNDMSFVKIINTGEMDDYNKFCVDKSGRIFLAGFKIGILDLNNWTVKLIRDDGIKRFQGYLAGNQNEIEYSDVVLTYFNRIVCKRHFKQIQGSTYDDVPNSVSFDDNEVCTFDFDPENNTTKIIEKRKDIRVNSIRLNDKNEIEILSENEIQIYTLD